MSMISWQMTEVNKPMIKIESSLPTPGQGEVLLRVAGCVKCFPLSEINTVFEMVHSRKILQRPVMVPDSLI